MNSRGNVTFTVAIGKQCRPSRAVRTAQDRNDLQVLMTMQISDFLYVFEIHRDKFAASRSAVLRQLHKKFALTINFGGPLPVNSMVHGLRAGVCRGKNLESANFRVWTWVFAVLTPGTQKPRYLLNPQSYCSSEHDSYTVIL